MSDTIQRHPAAVAWDEWLASDEGQRCRAAADFTPAGYWQDWENRLARAFQAGYDAALPPYQRRTAKGSGRESRLVAMREMKAAGKSLSEIGKEFGVSKQRVGQLLA
jgi:hypothetical protein